MKYIEQTEEIHRRTGSCYKHCINAGNSTARDSSYIRKGFRLQVRFVETGLGWFDKEKKVGNGQMGREIVPKTEKVRKNVIV